MAVSRAVVLAALAVVGVGLGVPVAAADAGNRIHFEVCSRTPADPAATNLRATTVPDGEPAGIAYDLAPNASEVTLEHGLQLELPDGMLGSGSGFDVTYASPEGKPFRVAAGAVTADVTLAVADSPHSGRRVAFVELRLAPEAPVRWVEEPALEIGTDGGDGGFFSTLNVSPYGNTGSADFDRGVDDVGEVLFPGGDSGRGIVCAVRRDDLQPLPTGFDFLTGYGDGGYPTLLGEDAADRIVSVVSYGFVVPWALSGLPGTPPQFVTDESARRLATPDPTAPPDIRATSVATAPVLSEASQVSHYGAVAVAIGIAAGAMIYQSLRRRRASGSP